MKRQGRQHGMVRTYPILSTPRPRPELGSPPTAGLFAKVSSKPTNHSKFTSKCGRPKCNDCHIYPACKSKDKVKGAQKTRSSSDVVTTYKLITWRVVDAAGFSVSGFSAKGVLDYLDSDQDYMDDYGCEADQYSFDHDDESYDHHEMISSHGVEIKEVDDNNDDDDDGMSFCEVGFVWEAVEGDESWCLVEEM